MARFLDAIGDFLAKAWRRLEVPITEIFNHVVVTIVSLLGIAAIDLTVRTLGLGGKTILGTGVLLSDWLFILDVAASTLIIVVGIFRALRELVR